MADVASTETTEVKASEVAQDTAEADFTRTIKVNEITVKIDMLN